MIHFMKVERFPSFRITALATALISVAGFSILSVGCERWRPERTVRSERSAEEPEPESVGEEEPAFTNAVAEADRARFATPEACFLALQQACLDQNVPVLLSCLDPPDQYRLLGWMALQVDQELFYDREGAAAAEQVLQEFGITAGVPMTYLQMKANDPPPALDRAAFELGSLIQEPVEFAEAAVRVVGLKKAGFDFDKLPQGTLADLDIVGTRAKAMIRYPGQADGTRIGFKRYSGSWVISTVQ